MCRKGFGRLMGPALLGAIALLMVMFSSSGVFAQTTIPGGNLGDQHWTTADSPVTIQGDATIQDWATLTIDAGVEVRFSTSDGNSSGRDTSDVELTINGTIDVNGTANAPVVFKGDGSSSQGAWYGVILTSSVTSASFEHAQMGTHFRIVLYAHRPAAAEASIRHLERGTWHHLLDQFRLFSRHFDDRPVHQRR